MVFMYIDIVFINTTHVHFASQTTFADEENDKQTCQQTPMTDAYLVCLEV